MSKKSSTAAIPLAMAEDSSRPITTSSQGVGHALVLNQEMVQQFVATQQQQLQQQQQQALARTTGPASKRTRSSFDKKAVIAGQMQPQETKNIGFIGAGNMARALAEGWISTGASHYSRGSTLVS